MKRRNILKSLFGFIATLIFPRVHAINASQRVTYHAYVGPFVFRPFRYCSPYCKTVRNWNVTSDPVSPWFNSQDECNVWLSKRGETMASLQLNGYPMEEFWSEQEANDFYAEMASKKRYQSKEGIEFLEQNKSQDLARIRSYESYP